MKMEPSVVCVCVCVHALNGFADPRCNLEYWDTIGYQQKGHFFTKNEHKNSNLFLKVLQQNNFS